MASNEQIRVLPPEPEHILISQLGFIAMCTLTKAERKILYHIFNIMDINNQLSIGKYGREYIAEDLGLSVNTVRKTINKLYKNKILLKLNFVEYIVNHEYFKKG